MEAVPARLTRASGAASRGGAAPPRRSVRGRRWATVAALLIGAALAAARAQATVVVAKDFAALCAESDLIFVGTVTEVTSRWSDPERQAIETLVTFRDLVWLRGAPQSAVTLRFDGGSVDGVHEEVAGMPRFTVGERRVIFAHEGRFVSPIVGFDQGALPVVEGPDGPVVLGADAAAPRGGALRLGATPNPSPAPAPLDEFLDRVRRQLATPASDGPP